MSELTNLTEDQRRRLEEKAAVIREAIGEPRELGVEELEAVSGGGQEVVIPSTHEEIDALWDLVEYYGEGIELRAAMMAYELKLIPFVALPVDHCTSYFYDHTIEGERARMHRMLDAQQG